jgi:pimeloyl-ACP methyl ester carboxylesterase
MVNSSSLTSLPIPNVWERPEDAGLFTKLTTFPKDWNSYRQKLRSQLWKLLGTSYDENLPLDYQVLKEFSYDNIIIKTVIYQTRPNIYTTATIYHPQGDGPFPGVLNLHGHWLEGRLAPRVQSRGLLLAKNGYLVLSPDTFGLGERSTIHTQYEHHGRTLGASLYNVGETLMGCILVDNKRSIDLLLSLKEVDNNNIGVTGASGGGNQTMWLAAMDDRIKAAVPVCSVGSFASYIGEPNCVCETLPGGLKVTEMAGILALAAPKAMLICTGLYDVKTFSPHEMLRSYNAAKVVYQSMGAASNFSYTILNQGHAYSKEARMAMLGFFDLHLKGIGNGQPKEEVLYRTLEREELLAFEAGQRPQEIVSVAQYCYTKGQELHQQLLARSSFKQDEEIAKLFNLLKVDTSLTVTEDVELVPIDIWQRFQLTLSDGKNIPLVYLENGNKITLFTHFNGKQNVPNSTLDNAYKDKSTIALVDLTGHGETQADPDRVRPYHQLSRSLLWQGSTLCGVWTSQIISIVNYLAQKYPTKTITLHGFKETALACIYASLGCKNVSEVILEDAPVSYTFKEVSEFFGMALFVPGILNWGDVSLAIALSDVKFSWINPRNQAGKIVAPPEDEIINLRNKIQRNQ